MDIALARPPRYTYDEVKKTDFKPRQKRKTQHNTNKKTSRFFPERRDEANPIVIQSKWKAME
jgi:hypothetical protein